MSWDVKHIAHCSAYPVDEALCQSRSGKSRREDLPQTGLIWCLVCLDVVFVVLPVVIYCHMSWYVVILYFRAAEAAKEATQKAFCDRELAVTAKSKDCYKRVPSDKQYILRIISTTNSNNNNNVITHIDTYIQHNGNKTTNKYTRNYEVQGPRPRAVRPACVAAA